MSDKSYVTMEQNVCPVCGKVFDTGDLLLDMRLSKRFDRYTVTDYSLCPEHKQQEEDGYIFLIELSEAPVKGQEPKRTGRIASLKKEVATQIFNREMAPISYVEVGVMDALEKMAA